MKHIAISPELHKRLKFFSLQTGATMTATAERILYHGMNSLEKAVDLRQGGLDLPGKNPQNVASNEETV